MVVKLLIARLERVALKMKSHLNGNTILKWQVDISKVQELPSTLVLGR